MTLSASMFSPFMNGDTLVCIRYFIFFNVRELFYLRVFFLINVSLKFLFDFMFSRLSVSNSLDDIIDEIIRKINEISNNSTAQLIM